MSNQKSGNRLHSRDAGASALQRKGFLRSIYVMLPEMESFAKGSEFQLQLPEGKNGTGRIMYQKGSGVLQLAMKSGLSSALEAGFK